MSRPTLLERVNARMRGRKAFSQPPFWSQPDARLGFGVPWSTPDRERIDNDFIGYVRGAYKASGPVFAVIAARQAIFSQVRFAWRQFHGGKTGDLFGGDELALLEKPWPNATTVDLLNRMEPIASLSGNWYGTKVDDAGRMGNAAQGQGLRIAEMRPDWVTIVIASPSDNPYDLRAKIAGYLYEPMGFGRNGAIADDAVILLTDEVCHYAPQPDPEARYRGMSWLTPVLREIQADKAATVHKDRFFANGATLNTVVRFDKETSKEAFDAFVDRFNAAHKGEGNAYKTLFLGGGADVTVIGADMQQLDFKATQGAGETRIAAAGGVHPAIVGLSEGLQGSSLNAGNFGAARRLVSDKTLKHLWSVAAPSLQTLVKPPNGTSSLWYDASDVAFLREDQKDAAEIQFRQAQTIRQLIDAGYTADSVTAAVQDEDWSLLAHSGLFSVQLQPAGANQANPTGKEG